VNSGFATVNQKQAPDDFREGGTSWEDLGSSPYTVTSGILYVFLTDQADGFVIADAVRVERDIVFSTAGETRLKADVYLPAARGTYPVVLLVSGGSVDDWRTAAFYTSFARVLAAEGLAAVSYDKRPARDSVPAANHDSLAIVD